jgi:hypothetical protein
MDRQTDVHWKGYQASGSHCSEQVTETSETTPYREMNNVRAEYSDSKLGHLSALCIPKPLTLPPQPQHHFPLAAHSLWGAISLTSSTFQIIHCSLPPASSVFPVLPPLLGVNDGSALQFTKHNDTH